MVVGIDTNILCYALDPAFPEHRSVASLLVGASPDSQVAIGPTVVHETYHTLVYDQKWQREDAKTRLALVLKHPSVKFYNQTKSVSSLGLDLATKYKLGGRDSLVLACFLANGVSKIYSHDSHLVMLGEVGWKALMTKVVDPLAS